MFAIGAVEHSRIGHGVSVRVCGQGFAGLCFRRAPEHRAGFFAGTPVW